MELQNLTFSTYNFSLVFLSSLSQITIGVILDFHNHLCSRWVTMLTQRWNSQSRFPWTIGFTDHQALLIIQKMPERTKQRHWISFWRSGNYPFDGKTLTVVTDRLSQCIRKYWSPRKLFPLWPFSVKKRPMTISLSS